MANITRLRANPTPTTEADARYTGRLEDWTTPRPSCVPNDIWEVRRASAPSANNRESKKVPSPVIDPVGVPLRLAA